MKRNKYFILLLLLVFAIMVVFRFEYGNNKNEVENQVVLRFAITSNTCVSEEYSFELANFLNKVYDYADSEEYKDVDLFVVNGDLTNDGSLESFDEAQLVLDELLRDNSKFFTTIGEMDYSENQLEINESEYFKDTLNTSFNIKGFNFILFSTEYNSYASKIGWLKSQLKQLSDTNKPIFVIQPGAIKDTFYGSSNYYVYEHYLLSEVIEKYENVIDISSSCPTLANIKSSVAKNNAYYVNSGSIEQIIFNPNEFGIDTSNAQIDSRFENVKQCSIFEVYVNGDVDIKILDLSEEDSVAQDICTINSKDTKYNMPDDVPDCSDAKIKIMYDGTHKVEVSGFRDNDGILFYKLICYDNENNLVCEDIKYNDVVHLDNNTNIFIIDSEIAGKINKIEVIAYDILGNNNNIFINDCCFTN